MKALLPWITLLGLLALSACKKDDASPTPEPPTQDTTGTPAALFTFVLDGTTVTLDGGHATITPLAGGIFELAIAGATPTSSGTITVRTDSLVGQVVDTPFSGERSFAIAYGEFNSTNTYASDTINPLGSLAIVQMDTVIGGFVEGIFSADGMYYVDQGGNIISAGHTIVGGFSVPIVQ